MKSIPLVLFGLTVTTMGGLYGWTRFRSGLPEGRQDLVIIEGPTKHLVTEEMAIAGRTMLDRPAFRFAKPGTDGVTHELDEMLRQGPVLLTFIKQGCPCSEAAQTYFNQIHEAYPRVSMLGVINVEIESAKRWAARFHANYPLLLDPAEELVRGYEVENSAYAVLIDRDGRIVKYWPGYSESMLNQLGSSLARMTGSTERKLDFRDAPTELYTGCPYAL